jgi:hypothetical protein
MPRTAGYGLALFGLLAVIAVVAVGREMLALGKASAYAERRKLDRLATASVTCAAGCPADLVHGMLVEITVVAKAS